MTSVVCLIIYFFFQVLLLIYVIYSNSKLFCYLTVIHMCLAMHAFTYTFMFGCIMYVFPCISLPIISIYSCIFLSIAISKHLFFSFFLRTLKHSRIFRNGLIKCSKVKWWGFSSV